MKYDRQIALSVANTRKSTSWQPWNTTIAEFYEKLKTPVRSTEKLEEYLRLNKAQQDDLKDVGGFVGGSLDGGRRKANAVTGRDVVTLDYDKIPPYGTEAILNTVAALKCGYVIYSTRKHMPTAPRLRILFPLDRTVSADEYEPIALRHSRRAASCTGRHALLTRSTFIRAQTRRFYQRMRCLRPMPTGTISTAGRRFPALCPISALR